MADSENVEIVTDGNISEPLLQTEKESEAECRNGDDDKELFMVYLSTFVAVWGAFEFGSCVSYKACSIPVSKNVIL